MGKQEAALVQPHAFLCITTAVLDANPIIISCLLIHYQDDMGFLEREFLMVLAIYEDNTKQGNLTMRTRHVSQNLSVFQHLPKQPKSKLESSWKICG